MSGQENKKNRRHTDRGLDHINNTLWKKLDEAGTDEDFCYSWLGLMSGIIGGVRGGSVVLGQSEDDSLVPVAFWPSGLKERKPLAEITERALDEKKGVVLKKKSYDEDGLSKKFFYLVAFPIRIDTGINGAAALKITLRPEEHLQHAMRQLQWGMAWLVKWIFKNDFNRSKVVNDRLTLAIDLTALTLQEEHFQAAATSFVTILATRLNCDRVGIGFVRGRNARVNAISHSAQFKKQMNLVRSIGNAMDESLDQQKVLVYPVLSGNSNGDILYAHEELARQQEHGSVCTIPFIDKDGRGYGALTLERSLDNPFDSEVVEMCDSVSAIVAPILEEKRKNDRILIKKVWESLCLHTKKLTGPEHVAVKLSCTLILFLLVFFTFAKGEYRVASKVRIEGKVQRSVAAPYDSYIFEDYVRAGDSVVKGLVMCRLDDRDMKLEHLRWRSQRGQYLRQYREAMANGERAETKILKEQINQSEAQIALLDEQLSRTKLTAPFEGIVISGDLSQSLGAPVERGEVLYEIAPLHDYRVKLEVDERDISQIRVGQTGKMVLNALPGSQLGITVEKITPVSTAEEGVNYFLVEARLDGPSRRLRPGMEGFCKVSVRRCRLIWIWTHDLTDWLRLWAWSWWP